MIQIYESSSIYIINNKLYLMSEEKEKIQKYIIKSTPYGELTQVLKDLDKISPVDLNSPILSQAL